MRGRNNGLWLTVLCVISAFASIPSAQAAVIALNNASFEAPVCPNDGDYVTGQADGWNLGGSSLGVANPTSSWFGPEAQDGQNVGYANDGCDFYQVVPGGVTFQDNITYTLSVYVGRPELGNTNGGEVRIQIRDIVLDDPMVIQSFSITNNSEWYLCSISYTAASGNDGHGIGIALATLSGTQLEYDNVILTATPEPATMSLLLAGGLVMLKRRR